MIDLQLTAESKEKFQIRLIALFKEFKAKKLNHRLWKYQVGNIKFHIYPSDHLFTVWMLEKGQMERVTCTNEDNVYEKIRSILKREPDK